MAPLEPGEIRARRRPFVVLGIAALRLLVGFCLAYPLAALVAESGVGQRAEGDRVLFEGGSYLLLEVLRLSGSQLSAAAGGLIPLFGLALLMGAACNAALLLALNYGGRLKLRDWLAGALGRLPGLLVLAGGTGLGQVVLFALGAALASALPDSMPRPVATTAGQALVWLLFAGAAGALGGIADIAKASLVRHEASIVGALEQALRCLARRPLRTCFGWLPYALALAVGLASVAKLTELADVSRPGAWRIGLVFVMHQLVVLLAVMLRAAWFARALRLAAAATAA